MIVCSTTVFRSSCFRITSCSKPLQSPCAVSFLTTFRIQSCNLSGRGDCMVIVLRPGKVPVSCNSSKVRGPDNRALQSEVLKARKGCQRDLLDRASECAEASEVCCRHFHFHAQVSYVLTPRRMYHTKQLGEVGLYHALRGGVHIPACRSH